MDHNCFLLSLYHVFKHNLIVLIWTFQTLVIEKFLPGKKEKIKLVITLPQKDYPNIDKSIFQGKTGGQT